MVETQETLTKNGKYEDDYGDDDGDDDDDDVGDMEEDSNGSATPGIPAPI